MPQVLLTSPKAGESSRHIVIKGLRFFRRYKIPIASATLFFFILMTISCNYYKIISFNDQKEQQEALKQAYAEKNYFLVMHEGTDSTKGPEEKTDDKVQYIKSMKINDDHLEFNSTNYIPRNVARAKDSSKPEQKRYKAQEGSILLNEVRIIVKQDYQLHTGSNVLQYNEIERIDVLDKDTGRTIASHFFGTLGIIAGVFVVILIIAALTKSSCPFIYTYNGEHYDFQGEVYSGAFHAPLERHDYMPLPGFMPHQNAYRLKISNELKERQFIDLAELIVMEHGMDEKVLIDKYGKYHSVTNPQAPLHAYSTKGTDITSTLKNRDGHCYLFNDTQADQPLDHTILQFTKPEGIKQAKLVVSGKGSLWLDYVYGEFTKLFGENYNAWCEKQRKEKPEVLQKQRIDNHIPIEVCLWEHGEWKYIDHFELVGPLGHAREMVLPIDLAGVDEDVITIRFRTGFFFWEVDYAGLDFSQDRVVKKMTIGASRAHDQLGNDVEQTLAEEDYSYLEQERIGEYTELYFPAPALRTDRDYSVFLHTKGYYEHIRQYDSAPQLAKLITFYIPGRFAAYSRELYQERHELFRTLDEPVILSSGREQREYNQ